MAVVGGSGTGSGTRPGGPVTRTDGSVRPATGDLQALCLGFVEQLKDEALHVLLSREAGLLALLPEQAAGLDDRGRGRLLAKVFAKVTVSDDPTLLQARDLLGLSASDPGIEDRLVRLAATDASTDPRNTTTRLGLAASVTGKSVRTVRRHAGAILRRLLEATQDFMQDDGLVQELMDELWTRDEGVADPLDGPGVRRVLRLCDQFAGELDQVFDTVHGATSFSTGLYVARGVQQDLLDRLDDPEAVVAVIGEAGYGKTSLLWGLHRELSRGLAGGSSGARFSHPLLVNAAWLQMPGRAAILPGEDLVRAVTALADRGADPVVLLDTLDLLLHDKDESVRAIDLVWELRGAGARVVVSCREQEANALDRRFATVRLGVYDETELPSAIKRHVLAFCPAAPPQPIDEKVTIMLGLASRGLGMTEVCHHPLFLRLLFEAYEGTFPTEEVDAQGVLSAYFDQKIRDDVRGRIKPDVARDDVHPACFCLAIALFSAGTVALPREELLDRALRAARDWEGTSAVVLASALDLLIRRSVLLADSPDGVRFRHQLLFEYVAARALVARGGAAELRRLLGIVEERPLDLFIGAVLEQGMIYARAAYRTLRPSVDELVDGLAGSPSVSLQSMALVVAAHHPDVDADIAGLLSRVDQKAVRRFVELTPRVGGRRIGQALALLRQAWRREEMVCRRAVLNVLERIAVGHGPAVRDFIVELDCVKHVADAGEDLLLSQRALPRTLGLLAEIDAAWSTDSLLMLFEAGCAKAKNRALAVAILNIVADHWDHLGSGRTLARFTLALCRAQQQNGGQEAEAVRLAGGQLFALYWSDRYGFAKPNPRTADWLGLIAALRRRLATNPQAPLRVQLRLMGATIVLTALSVDDPLIAPTIGLLFPPAEECYGLPMLELSDSFLVPLLTSGSPAGAHSRALIRDALGDLPADPDRTDDSPFLRGTPLRVADRDGAHGQAEHPTAHGQTSRPRPTPGQGHRAHAVARRRGFQRPARDRSAIRRPRHPGGRP